MTEAGDTPMLRWTTVSALLLLVGGATYGAWHLMDPSGPASDDDAYGASALESERATDDASSEAPMTLRRDSASSGATSEGDDQGGALVARWENEAAERRRSIARVVDRLSTTPHWKAARKRYHEVHRPSDPEHNLAQLKLILAEADDPMARQNLIFLAVLTLPTDLSRPWLRGLRGTGDAADAEDAIVALAFDGEPESAADFRALATTPSTAKVRRLWEGDGRGEYEKILAEGPGGARAILRSYRAIEVLDRRLYFKVSRTSRPASWVDHPRPDDRRFKREVEEAWLARYPGHPGSDDMAWRIGQAFSTDGDHIEACRWYSLASVVPDQDVTYPALRDLLLTCELLLSPEDVWRISPRPDDPNFDLLDYVAMRRVAASRGFEAALDHARMRGASEPGSLVGHAWNMRRTAEIPHGVNSGETRLRRGDPLLRMATWSPRPAHADDPERTLSSMFWRSHYPDPDDLGRLTERTLALAPNARKVALQLRQWETMAELARRERDAGGVARADLIYKQAAIAYHHPKLLFPLWDWANRNFGERLRGLALRKVLADPDGFDRARQQFEQESYAPYLAMRLFERVEREHPEYPRIDKAIYSRGLAWKKLIDFWPFDAYGAAPAGMTKEQRMDGAVRALVQTFEHLAATYPDSTLTDDALSAIAYWRRERPGAFGR